MLDSKIEWTDATWNPWQGCTKVSPACAHCYMFRDLKRFGRDGSIVIRSKPPTFNLPLKKIGARGHEFAIPSGFKVFTCSWSDWFHPAADEWRDEAWGIIRQRSDVVFQIVTKRTERILNCLPSDWGKGWSNVWLIATVENQEWADVRIPQLLQAPAAVRGLSMEPLLGPVRLCRCIGLHDPIERAIKSNHGLTCPLHWLDWVIVGGESGPNARPMHPDWARSIRDQCHAAGVPFFFKQWGEWIPISDFPESEWQKLYISKRKARPFENQSEIDDCYGRRCTVSTSHVRFDGVHGNSWKLLEVVEGHPTYMTFRVGKKIAGRLLDGREWNDFPQTSLT